MNRSQNLKLKMVEFISKSKTTGQFLKYLVTGATAFILEYLIFLLFYNSFKIDSLLANPIAVMTGFWYSFLMNKFWSFKSKNHLGRQLSQYVVLFVFNIVVSNILIYLFEKYLRISPAVTKPFAMCMIATWNFVICKKIIYVEKEGEGNAK